MKEIDKYRGCLLGGAAGDALGYTVEFMDEREIFARYGAAGITEYELKHGVAEISDDTQMTLFTAKGLLLAEASAQEGSPEYTAHIAACYKDWFRTQWENGPRKGCGGVMRVAPIGLYFEGTHETLDAIDRIGAEAAALTHGHELGYSGGGFGAYRSFGISS